MPSPLQSVYSFHHPQTILLSLTPTLPSQSAGVTSAARVCGYFPPPHHLLISSPIRFDCPLNQPLIRPKPMFEQQVILDCVCSSSDSGEARNTLDDCIALLLSLPLPVRHDIMTSPLIAALSPLSQSSSASSSSLSSFCAHASSALHAAGLFPPPSLLSSFDELPSSLAQPLGCLFLLFTVCVFPIILYTILHYYFKLQA
jgi:hypothetical protein